MFPLIQRGSREWVRLLDSIREEGQVQPIVMDGDMLLDGRNRMAVCETLGIEPKTVQWRDLGMTMDKEDWIEAVNVERRHLTPDQFTTICTQINLYRDEQYAKEMKAQSQLAGKDKNGKPVRKDKSSVNLNSDSPISESPKRDIKEMNANSTAGKIAEKAGTSRHKAQQAIDIIKAAANGDIPAEAVQAVINGDAKLKDVAKQVPKKTKSPRKPTDPVEKAIRLIKSMTKEDVKRFAEFFEGYAL